MQRYEFVEIRGEGTYGVVLKCKDKQTGDIVAVKRFKDLKVNDYVRCTIFRELKVEQLLRGQPYVVQLLEAFKENGRYYLVMEFISLNLLDLLDANPTGLAIEQLKVLMYTILRGVHSCHHTGVIHRDIKPENILVRENGTAFVCDFGFSRPMKRTNNADGFDAKFKGLVLPTRKGDMTDYVATRWYRSPEMLLGMPTYDYSVDVWAVGCIMAEATNGEPLLPGKTEIEQLALIQSRVCELPHLYQSLAFTHHGAMIPRLDERDKPKNGASESYLQATFGKKLGADGLDLLTRLLSPESKTRITAEEALRHPFFKGVASKYNLDPSSHPDPASYKHFDSPLIASLSDVHQVDTGRENSEDISDFSSDTDDGLGDSVPSVREEVLSPQSPPLGRLAATVSSAVPHAGAAPVPKRPEDLLTKERKIASTPPAAAPVADVLAQTTKKVKRTKHRHRVEKDGEQASNASGASPQTGEASGAAHPPKVDKSRRKKSKMHTLSSTQRTRASKRSERAADRPVESLGKRMHDVGNGGKPKEPLPASSTSALPFQQQRTLTGPAPPPTPECATSATKITTSPQTKTKIPAIQRNNLCTTTAPAPVKTAAKPLAPVVPKKGSKPLKAPRPNSEGEAKFLLEIQELMKGTEEEEGGEDEDSVLLISPTTPPATSVKPLKAKKGSVPKAHATAASAQPSETLPEIVEDLSKADYAEDRHARSSSSSADTDDDTNAPSMLFRSRRGVSETGIGASSTNFGINGDDWSSTSRFVAPGAQRPVPFTRFMQHHNSVPNITPHTSTNTNSMASSPRFGLGTLAAGASGPATQRQESFCTSSATGDSEGAERFQRRLSAVQADLSPSENAPVSPGKASPHEQAIPTVSGSRGCSHKTNAAAASTMTPEKSGAPAEELGSDSPQPQPVHRRVHSTNSSGIALNAQQGNGSSLPKGTSIDSVCRFQQANSTSRRKRLIL